MLFRSQALRVVIAPTGNQYVDALKDTAILSIIGVPELMRMAQQQAELMYRPFEFYTIAGFLYFLAVLGVTKIFTKIENKVSHGHKADAIATNAIPNLGQIH